MSDPRPSAESTSHAVGAEAVPRGGLLLAGVLLLLGVLFAYRDAPELGFVSFDDSGYVYENPRVRGGLTVDGVVAAFRSFEMGNWHPLTWLSHMLDAELFGPDATGPQHVVNVALHGLNTLLVFALLALGTGRVGAAFFVAALFGWHPLRVESVAWISERKDVLSAFLGLAALLAYGRWARRGGGGAYFASLGVALLALLAKPMLVTLPLLMVVADLWPLRRLDGPRAWRARVVEKLPLLAMCVALGAVTILAQGSDRAIVDLERMPVGLRLENALASVTTYLRQTLWPQGLIFYYPHAVVSAADPVRALAGRALLGGGLLGVAFVWAFRARARRPYLLAGLAWFTITLLPVAGLVQVGGQGHADRYTYLPLIGVVAAVVFALDDALRARARPAAACVGGLALVALLAHTDDQVRTWRDSDALYGHALAVMPRNHQAHENLGYVRLAEGRHAEAAEHLRQALRFGPVKHELRLTLAGLELELGRLDEAQALIDGLLRAWPQDWRVHSLHGQRAFRAQELQLASRAYARAFELGSEDVGDRVQWGTLLLGEGELERAAEQFEHARTAAPEDPMPRLGLARVAMAAGRWGEARRWLEEALVLAPGLPAAERALERVRRQERGGG